jgi:cell division septation protein DedD
MIELPVWLFPTPVISNIPSASNAPSASDVSTPPTHQPHVDLSPSSPIRSPSLSPSSPSEISKASNEVDKKNKKQKEKKKKNQKGAKPPTTSTMLDPSNQLWLIVLGVLINSTRLKQIILNPNSLAVFVRVTTF